MCSHVAGDMTRTLTFVLALGSLLLSVEGAPDAVWDGGKLTPRRLDPSRPWLKPENNWGQGFSNSVSKLGGRRLDPTRPDLKPGQGSFAFGGDPDSWLAGRRLDPTRPVQKPGNTWGIAYGASTSGMGGRRLDPTRPVQKPGNNWGIAYGGGGLGPSPWKPGSGMKPPYRMGKRKPGFGTKPWKPGMASGWKPGNLNSKPWAVPSGLLKKDSKFAQSGDPFKGFKYGGLAKDLKYSKAGNPFTKDIKFGGSGNPWAGASNPYTKDITFGGSGNPWAGGFTKPGKSPFKGGIMPCRPSRANGFCGSPGWKPAIVKPGEINLGKVKGTALFPKKPSLISSSGKFGTLDLGMKPVLLI